MFVRLAQQCTGLLASLRTDFKAIRLYNADWDHNWSAKGLLSGECKQIVVHDRPVHPQLQRHAERPDLTMTMPAR